MSDLIPQADALTPALMREELARIDAALLPTDALGAYFSDPAEQAKAPALPRIQAMLRLVRAGLGMTSAPVAAKAATVLLDSWPQKDQAGAVYTRGVALRLRSCPPDLLDDVIADLVDRHVHRPSIAEVKASVARIAGRRRHLLLRLTAAEAGRKRHEAREEQRRRDELARRAAEAVALDLRVVAEAPPLPVVDTRPVLEKQRREVRRLTPDEVRAARAQAGAVRHR